MDNLPKLTGNFGMPSQQRPSASTSGNEPKELSSAPMHRPSAMELTELTANADRAGGFSCDSPMIQVIQHRLQYFSNPQTYNEECLNKAHADMQIMHRTRIALEQSQAS